MCALTTLNLFHCLWLLAAVRDHVDALYFYTAFQGGSWRFQKPAGITVVRAVLLAVFVNNYCIHTMTSLGGEVSWRQDFFVLATVVGGQGECASLQVWGKLEDVHFHCEALLLHGGIPAFPSEEFTAGIGHRMFLSSTVWASTAPMPTSEASV